MTLIYYLDQKVPGIYSENLKYKFYSSKMILSPSKYSPSTATHLCQRLITDNDGIVRRCVIMMQNPRVVCPQIQNRKNVQRCTQDGVTFTNVKLW